MHHDRTVRSGRRRLLAGVALASLIVASCGGDDDDSESASASADAATESSDAASVDDTATTVADSTGGESSDEESSADGSSGDGFVEDPNQLNSEGEGAQGTDMEPQAGGVLRVGLAADGTGFNTDAAISPGSARIVNALNDSLVGFDTDGNAAPLLAESVTPNEDATVWTIKLRPGVTFHDGVPVDAAAVKANLDAFRASPSVGYGMASVTDIVAVDDLTVEVQLASPWFAFDNYLGGQPGWMVSPSTIGTNDTFVGTGPFVLESWTPGDSARVVRNENYWREGEPYLDAIEFKFIPDGNVRRQALESGDVDVYTNVYDTDILDFLDDDAIDVWIGEAASNEALFVLNTAAPPFDDLRVRQAMAYALDRELIIDAIRSGLTTPADGPINPGSKWYAEVDYPDYDPEMATQLVDEYEAENGPIEIVVKGEPTPDSQDLRDLAVSFWEDVGIDVTQEEIGLGQSVPVVLADDFQAIAWAQFSALDPDGERSFFHGGFPLNWSNFEDPVIDEALDTGRENGDFDTRYAAYAQFQQELAAQLPMIFVDHLNGVEAVASVPTVHNIADKSLPDGSPAIALLAGSFFTYENVWIEQ